MKKLILSLFLLLTVLSFAEIVYITPTGKKYHATKTCKGLVRAKKIIPIERKEAEAKGSGVISVDGKMVDNPIIMRAQRVLELAKASGIYKED